MGDTLHIGPFTILGTLGQGANSTILHVRRSGDSKQYALKVVPLEDKEDLKFLEQARHEFRVAQMLGHPNLIKIFALETPRDWLFRIRKVHLLIEYVNGKTLDTLPHLPVPKLAQIFEKTAAGMVHMHRRKVLHADLKPNNVMLSRSGDLKILDYGLAWIKGEPKNRVQGTPEYMAPEQAQHGIVSERSDIYNLGATMYRLLTFRLPPSVTASSEGVQMNAKTFDSLLKPVQEFNPKVPAQLGTLAQRCLAYHAHKRPESMAEVHEELKQIVEGLIRSPEDRLEALEW
jgi:serine/threonine protein kinase